ncbi:MAG: hypothetical protein QXH03_10870 [Candidatus Bathyarchaeia archaeon]
MSKVLFFHTPSVVELKDVKEEDGAIIIGDKKFYVDEIPEVKKKLEEDKGEVVRLMLKTKFGFQPLYLLKWDSLYPAKVSFKNISLQEIERKEELENVKSIVTNKPTEKIHLATIVFHRDLKNIPESLYKSEKLKILGGMFKVKREIKAFLPLLFGLILGILITFLMVRFKLIRM